MPNGNYSEDHKRVAAKENDPAKAKGKSAQTGKKIPGPSQSRAKGSNVKPKGSGS